MGGNKPKQQEATETGETATFQIPNTQALPVGLAAGQRLDSIPAWALAGTAGPHEPNTLGVSRYTL